MGTGMFSKKMLRFMKRTTEDGSLAKFAQTSAGRKAAAEGKKDALKAITDGFRDRF